MCLYLWNGAVAVGQLVTQVHLQFRVRNRAFARIGQQSSASGGGVIKQQPRRAERWLHRTVVAVGANRIAAGRLACWTVRSGLTHHEARLHLEHAVLDTTTLFKELRIYTTNVDISFGRTLDMTKFPVDAYDRVCYARAQGVRLICQILIKLY